MGANTALVGGLIAVGTTGWEAEREGPVPVCPDPAGGTLTFGPRAIARVAPLVGDAFPDTVRSRGALRRGVAFRRGRGWAAPGATGRVRFVEGVLDVWELFWRRAEDGATLRAAKTRFDGGTKST